MDQIPSKYVPGSKSTQAKIGEKIESVTGSNDKGAVTLTFLITTEGEFLPMRFIYGGKIRKNYPTVMYLNSFYKSVNEKHYSNEEQSLQLLKYVIVLYLETKRKMLSKPQQPW